MPQDRKRMKALPVFLFGQARERNPVARVPLSCFSRARQSLSGKSGIDIQLEATPMGIERQLRRLRRRLEGARLYAGLSGRSTALERVAQLERLSWRLERVLLRERRAA